jgi:hypothetical protein
VVISSTTPFNYGARLRADFVTATQTITRRSSPSSTGIYATKPTVLKRNLIDTV